MYFPEEYHLQCGARQGGVLSPVLFAVYVNSLIEMLHQSKYGCYVDSLFVGCVMYADDFLVSASIYKLQLMIEVCCSKAAKLDMKCNASKSQAIRIGRSCRTDICHITLNGCTICFVNELKYLGWYMISAKCFKVSLHQMRIIFFSPLTRFMRKVRTLRSLLFNILLTLTVSHTCCMDLKLLHGIIVSCLI